MKKFLLMLLCVSSVVSCFAQTPEKEIAKAAKSFCEGYYTGDMAVEKYVNFNGYYLGDIGVMTEEQAKETFSEEIAKFKGKEKPSVEVVKVEIYGSGEEIGMFINQPVAVALCNIDRKEEALLFYQVDGQWKIDITNKWAYDWFDGQIY